MNDRDQLLQLLDAWGVRYTIDDEGDIRVGREHNGDEAPKIVGYAGFFTCFEFDDDGNFTQMGAWE